MFLPPSGWPWASVDRTLALAPPKPEVKVIQNHFFWRFLAIFSENIGVFIVVHG
jgi:hypothetical protein